MNIRDENIDGGKSFDWGKIRQNIMFSLQTARQNGAAMENDLEMLIDKQINETQRKFLGGL